MIGIIAAVVAHGVIVWVLIRVLLLKAEIEKKPARWLFAMLLFPCLPWAELACPSSRGVALGKSITACRVVAFCFTFATWLYFIAGVQSWTVGERFHASLLMWLNAPLVLCVVISILRSVREKRALNSPPAEHASRPRSVPPI